MTVRKTAEPGFGGDAYPGETPQALNDQQSLYQHDEPGYEPGTADYNFFYGNGQLHVSPEDTHSHDDLRDHAGVPGGHAGPLAVGHVSVDRGRATWLVESNVALKGLARVFKDYTKHVGWQWGGLTSLEGEPIDDEFAPKKSMVLRDHELAVDRPFALQGKTAYVGKEITEAMRDALRREGYRVAEYPGGTNMNDRMRNYAPMGEDLELGNIYDPQPTENTTLSDDTPTGTFKCPKCRGVFPNWADYMDHRRQEDGMPDEDPKQDSHFPELPDMDKTLPGNFRDRQPFVMPLASVKEAERYDEFEEYADLYGLRESNVRCYGAYLNGEMRGVAAVRTDPSSSAGRLLFVGGRHSIDKTTLVRGVQAHFARLSYQAPNGDHLPDRLGFVGGKWAAGSDPKDQIDRPIPFVYDVKQDTISLGPQGSRHSDIPGEFTPGQIVEGTYEPGGKLILHTMTNVPLSVRHLLDLWYWMHPHMQITGLEQVDSQGNSTKLAMKTSTTSVGTYIKQLAATDPAVWNAYQALRKAGGKVYVVGGAVRDALLQKEPKDVDLLVAGLPAEEVNAALAGLPGRVDLTGKSFGVYRYNTKGHEVEVALPRTEKSTGERRVHFDVNVDHELPVEDDLLRRDFTVNSMAVDLESGELVDPYHGADDIENRRLRTTHPSSFQEDPTRLIRALVMNGRYGFHPDEQTRHEMQENAHRIDLESPDAKVPIIEKLFKSNDPARAIRLAKDTGVLKHIFPEVAHNWDYDQNNPHHNYSLGEHLVNVLENTAAQSSDPDLRIAALLHDIGKPGSAWINSDTGFNHFYRGPKGEGDDHWTLGANMAEKRLRDLSWPTARTQRIKHLIEHHMWPAFATPKGARKFIHRVGDEHADDLLALRYADQYGKGQKPEELAARTSVETQRGLVEQVRSAQQPTSVSGLAINGSDILALGVKPGPEIGRILRQLTDDVIEEPALNEKEALIQRAQEYVDASRR